MNTESKIYITAAELAESLGVSLGQAYKIIRQLNNDYISAIEGYVHDSETRTGTNRQLHYK